MMPVSDGSRVTRRRWTESGRQQANAKEKRNTNDGQLDSAGAAVEKVIGTFGQSLRNTEQAAH